MGHGVTNFDSPWTMGTLGMITFFMGVAIVDWKDVYAKFGFKMPFLYNISGLDITVRNFGSLEFNCTSIYMPHIRTYND